MQLEYLEYLTKITPGITINALAETLHISPSGLSKSLAALEKGFNCQLIIRTRKGIYLTSEAEEIARHTSDYLEKINPFRTVNHHLHDHITLPVTSYSLRFFGSESIGCFIKEYPNVLLETRNGSANNIHHMLNDNCEIALTFLLYFNGTFYPDNYNIFSPETAAIRWLEPKSDYTFVPCTTYNMCLECHKDLARQLNEFSMDDLSKKKIILNINPVTFPDFPIEQIIRSHYKWEYIIEPNRDLYYKFLQNKMGYGLSVYAKNYAEVLPRNIVHVLPKDKIDIIYGYLEKSSDHSPAVQYFIDTLKVKL